MYEEGDRRTWKARRERSTSRRALVATMLLTSALSGCAARPAPNDLPGAPREGEVLLVVDNHTYDAVRIYLVMDGTPQWIGRVEGLQRARFRIGEALEASHTDARIWAAPTKFDAGTWMSDRLTVERGEQVHVVVRNYLALSTFEVVPGHVAVRR